MEKVIGRQPVLVENATFADDLDFTGLPASPETANVSRVWVESPLFFRNCTFNGRVLAFRQQGDTTVLCHFGRNLTFINCRFNNQTQFQSVAVMGIGSFSGSQFNRPVSFEGARFGAEAYFDHALFATEARFQNVVFDRMAMFWQTKWAGVVYFQGSRFVGDAQFNLTEFRANLDFSLCISLGLLTFNYAQLSGRSSFANCRFQNAVDFSNATLTDASFSEALFDTKAQFINTGSTALSFENAVFLSRTPALKLTAPSPKTLNLDGASVMSGPTVTTPKRALRSPRYFGSAVR